MNIHHPSLQLTAHPQPHHQYLTAFTMDQFNRQRYDPSRPELASQQVVPNTDAVIPANDRPDSPQIGSGESIVFSRPSDISCEGTRASDTTDGSGGRDPLNDVYIRPFVFKDHIYQPNITVSPGANEGVVKDERKSLDSVPGCCLTVPKHLVKAKRSLVSLANRFKQDGGDSEDKGAAK